MSTNDNTKSRLIEIPEEGGYILVKGFLTSADTVFDGILELITKQKEFISSGTVSIKYESTIKRCSYG